MVLSTFTVPPLPPEICTVYVAAVVGVVTVCGVLLHPSVSQQADAANKSKQSRQSLGVVKRLRRTNITSRPAKQRTPVSSLGAPRLRLEAAWLPVVESVSTEVAVAPAVSVNVELASEHVGAEVTVCVPEETSQVRFTLPLNPPNELMTSVSSPIAPGAGKVTCCVAGVTVIPDDALTTVNTGEIEDDVYESPGHTAVRLCVPAASVGLKVAVAVVVLVLGDANAGAAFAISVVPSNNLTTGVPSTLVTFNNPEMFAVSTILVVLGVKNGPLRVVAGVNGVTVTVSGADVTGA